MTEEQPAHMYTYGLVDIPLSKDTALVADWHRLRKLAADVGYDLHQCNDLFELAGGEMGVNHSIVRFKTLHEVQDFLRR